jgi:hypothetical protein
MKLHITANKLAELILKTPEQRMSLVRKLHREYAKKKTDYPQHYMLLRGPAKRFLAEDGLDPTELTRLIQKLKTRQGTPWINLDSKITSEAAKALIKLGPQIKKLDAAFLLPGSGTKAVLEFPGVDVIATPNLIVHGTRNGRPLIGALRFYIAKERQFELGVRGAELVATMEHLWLTKTATGQRAPEPSLCIVVECFQERITMAPIDTNKHAKAIEDGCSAFVRLWYAIDSKDAA